MREDGGTPGRLAHRDLRNRSAEILRDVSSGATYEITNHGEVVAVLSPPTKGRDVRVRVRRVQGGFADLPRVRRDRTVQEELDELRDER